MRTLKISQNITRRDEKSLEKYFTEISKYQVMSPDEEFKLFERLNNGEDVLQEILNRNLRFVVSVAKQYQNLGLPLGDLISEGNVGLIKAAKRFDTSRGFKFISYAVWWIRQCILQAVNDKARKIRVPANVRGNTSKILAATSKILQEQEREPTTEELIAVTGISEEQIRKGLQFHNRCASLDAPLGSDSDAARHSLIEDEQIDSPDYEISDRGSMKVKIKEMLGYLPERQAMILAKYYGIGREHPASLAEISEEIGISRERIRQLKTRGILKLRKNFKNAVELLS